MARHDLLTNDPVNTDGLQIHTPDFGGTQAQRLAYPTAGLVWGMQWTESDTGTTYKWYGTYWGVMSNGLVVLLVTTATLPATGSVGFWYCITDTGQMAWWNAQIGAYSYVS